MWLYEDNELTEIPDGYVGFVYEITNNLSGKKYIGKKLFRFTKTKTIKGKRKKVLTESDWGCYYGSNDQLKSDVETHGSENFTRKILYLCKSKGELSYLEAYEQFSRNVLLHPDEYYNTWISCRIRRPHIKHLVENNKERD